MKRVRVSSSAGTVMACGYILGLIAGFAAYTNWTLIRSTF